MPPERTKTASWGPLGAENRGQERENGPKRGLGAPQAQPRPPKTRKMQNTFCYYVFFGCRRPRDRRSDAQRPHTRVIRVGMLRCTVRPSVRLYKGGSVKSPCSIWVSGHPSLIRHCTKTLHRQCCKVVFSSSLATFCN